MEILEKLFGGTARLRIMRLFIFNPDLMLDQKTIIEKTRVGASDARKEINLLAKAGLIKKKTVKNSTLWLLNESFQYLPTLKKLLVETVLSNHNEISKKIAKTCKLKSLILSGFFINNVETRADMLIVGQGVQKDVLKNTIKKIEAEIGKEIRYAILETDDFKYRVGIGDRLVRDMLDYPHVVAYDKLGMV